ncbi:hypothetical protein M427DRAFT_272212 [Gonapodya prolifera JEL478]|uniref:Exoribonuclease Xrn1 D2/D3 domain-containing protein n=1 Tax=Gonapodya prolifera (strain JEL478) TaxID=1344416 RepID=A0A139AXT2_GONPJ|nr:hypothetical protein M427DRAFT_272212 [Gonapodya prolifera JEL478]|eukprot:KXS21514.1 hypothetical protein M427DRAFT_272212 [Gonapodya prolifera JEL478]
MDSLDYKPNWQVASELGLKPITVSRITASLLVSIVGSGERVNIGLNMKFDAKQKKVLGYTRKTDQSWEYSKKAVDLIQAYKVQFPEVFAVIDRKQKDTFEASDFYSRDPTLIQNVSTWLKSVASKFELADLDCESLTRLHHPS